MLCIVYCGPNDCIMPLFLLDWCHINPFAGILQAD